MTEAPYLVTLGFDPSTFERLDRLRTRYFPPDRNLVPAHLSLFHQLPGDEGESIDRALFEATRGLPFLDVSFPGLKKTGRGMMATVEAPGLSALHSSLSRTFARWLTPQDRQPFRPHVTIMNKADRLEAEAAFEELRAAWSPWSGIGDRLILWRYLGGPWEEVESYDLTAKTSKAMSIDNSSRMGG